MQETQKQIIKDYLQACNQFDTERLVANIHDNLFFQNISNDKVTIETTDKAAFIEQAELTKTFFKERTITPTNWQVDGNTIKVSVDYKAILAVAFSDTLQPGDNFNVVGEMCFSFDGDKVTHLVYQI